MTETKAEIHYDRDGFSWDSPLAEEVCETIGADFLIQFVRARVVNGTVFVSATIGKPDEWDWLEDQCNAHGYVFVRRDSSRPLDPDLRLSDLLDEDHLAAYEAEYDDDPHDYRVLDYSETDTGFLAVVQADGWDVVLFVSDSTGFSFHRQDEVETIESFREDYGNLIDWTALGFGLLGAPEEEDCEDD